MGGLVALRAVQKHPEVRPFVTAVIFINSPTVGHPLIGLTSSFGRLFRDFSQILSENSEDPTGHWYLSFTSGRPDHLAPAKFCQAHGRQNSTNFPSQITLMEANGIYQGFSHINLLFSIPFLYPLAELLGTKEIHNQATVLQEVQSSYSAGSLPHLVRGGLSSGFELDDTHYSENESSAAADDHLHDDDVLGSEIEADKHGRSRNRWPKAAGQITKHKKFAKAISNGKDFEHGEGDEYDASSFTRTGVDIHLDVHWMDLNLYQGQKIVLYSLRNIDDAEEFFTFTVVVYTCSFDQKYAPPFEKGAAEYDYDGLQIHCDKHARVFIYEWGLRPVKWSSINYPGRMCVLKVKVDVASGVYLNVASGTNGWIRWSKDELYLTKDAWKQDPVSENAKKDDESTKQDDTTRYCGFWDWLYMVIAGIKKIEYLVDATGSFQNVGCKVKTADAAYLAFDTRAEILASEMEPPKFNSSTLQNGTAVFTMYHVDFGFPKDSDATAADSNTPQPMLFWTCAQAKHDDIFNNFGAFRIRMTDVELASEYRLVPAHMVPGLQPGSWVRARVVDSASHGGEESLETGRWASNKNSPLSYFFNPREFPHWIPHHDSETDFSWFTPRPEPISIFPSSISTSSNNRTKSVFLHPSAFFDTPQESLESGCDLNIIIFAHPSFKFKISTRANIPAFVSAVCRNHFNLVVAAWISILLFRAAIAISIFILPEHNITQKIWLARIFGPVLLLSSMVSFTNGASFYLPLYVHVFILSLGFCFVFVGRVLLYVLASVYRKIASRIQPLGHLYFFESATRQDGCQVTDANIFCVCDFLSMAFWCLLLPPVGALIVFLRSPILMNLQEVDSSTTGPRCREVASSSHQSDGSPDRDVVNIGSFRSGLSGVVALLFIPCFVTHLPPLAYFFWILIGMANSQGNNHSIYRPSIFVESLIVPSNLYDSYFESLTSLFPSVCPSIFASVVLIFAPRRNTHRILNSPHAGSVSAHRYYECIAAVYTLAACAVLPILCYYPERLDYVLAVSMGGLVAAYFCVPRANVSS